MTFAILFESLAWTLRHLRGTPDLPMMPVGPVEVPAPLRAYQDDVGLDLRAAIPAAMTLRAHGGRATLPCGWAVEIPVGYEGQIRPRSGHTKLGLVAVLGTVDPNYRGELHATIENHTDEDITVEPLERIAQLVVAPVARAVPRIVKTLRPSTTRGARGHGSSGRG